MSDVFSPDGLLAATLPGFEYRPQQGTMAHLVMETLKGGGVTLIEAGTGTGKSLAYLIPAAKFALETGERVVISTNTINLQEQLIQKDIPFVSSVFSPDLKAVLVKGWQNYLCLYRYQNALQGTADLFESEEQALQLAAIRDWVSSGPQEGSRTELPFNPSPSLWESICAESDTCLRQDCPLYNHCFVFQARREVEDAQLLVVNHHLLFADVAVRQVVGWQSEAVLPAYSRVVLDEAHHIEDVATEHLGSKLSELGLRQLLGRIARRSRRGEQRGYVGQLLSKLQTVGQAGLPIIDHVQRALLPAVQATSEMGASLFGALAEWVGESRDPGSSDSTWTIQSDAGWIRNVQPSAYEVTRSLRRVGEELRRVANMLREAGDFGPEAHESEALASRAGRSADVVEWLAAADDADHVFWLERHTRRDRGEQISMHSAPLEVGPHLSRWIGEALRSVVMCSATLTVADSFDYVMGRLGLQDCDQPSDAPSVAHAVSTAKIDSPFDYARQTALFIPTDIVEPAHPAFSAQLSRSLADVLVTCGGRAFVLFTSYAQLRYAADSLRDHLQRHGLPLWVQGEASRGHLLRGFLDHPGSVLFGTDSFWEGVDVQGEALSLVVIVKLPFEVPTHPIAKARTDRLREQGLNPFESYSVPRAALKLKQGFGRLIRSASDQGAVVIYDRRLTNRRYGQVLLSSLPDAPVYVRSLRDLPTSVSDIVNR